MAMTDKTSRKLRNATSGSFTPGSVVRGYRGNASANTMSYWASKGWIKKNGDMYVLTKKGYNAA